MIITAGQVKLNMLIRPVGSRARPVKVAEIDTCSDRHNIHINGACYFKSGTVEAGFKNGDLNK